MIRALWQIRVRVALAAARRRQAAPPYAGFFRSVVERDVFGNRNA